MSASMLRRSICRVRTGRRSRTAARGRPEPAAPRMGSVAAATRTLPRDIASFTGRKPELAELIAVVAEAAIFWWGGGYL